MKKLCIGITGSFCNHPHLPIILDKLKNNYEITFVVSDNVQKTNTRFGTYDNLVKLLHKYTNKKRQLKLTKTMIMNKIKKWFPF